MRYFKKLFLIAAMILLSLQVYAQDTQAPASNASTAAQATTPQTATTALPANAITCPAVDDLVKDPRTLKWKGKEAHGSRWQPYEMSFVEQLASFVGAQWHGTNVGQVFCIYHGPDKTSFAVMVLFHALVYTPSGGQWSKNLGGYLNCHSQKQADCFFTPQTKAKQTDIYKEAESLKTDQPQELGY